MKNILSYLLLAASLSAHAQSSVTLNKGWKFFYAKNVNQADSLAATGFEQPGYNAASFKPTPVPSCWAVLGYEEPIYREFAPDQTSEGFYLLKFTTPAGYDSKRVLLNFGGVWNSAEVWLNGERLGRHDSGFTSFAYNITGKLNKDGENVLAVRVRQVYPGYKTDTYDDWSLGGIYRDVTLDAMPAKRWIDKVTVLTSFSNDYHDGVLTLRTIVADTSKNTRPGNYPSPSSPYQLHITLKDQVGNTMADRTLNVNARASSSHETTEQIVVKDVKQWNAETPNLYALTIELMEKGKPTQTYRHKIGFREITTSGGVLRINGKPVKLRGVNRHDEWPTVGRATTREHWIKDIKMMKEANINYIRACHYQHAKGFIETCDSMGMYVGSEVSLGGAGGMMYDPSYSQAVMLRSVETVERDLNNPSIIYWSVGNEDPFTAMHLQAIRAIKGLDKTRPVLMPWNADETLPKEIDILAPHYWTAHEYDSIAAHSDRPIITTEYTHAYGTKRFGGLYDRWHALTKHPSGAGGAIWMWADQGLRTPVKKDMKRYGSIEKDDPYLRVSTAGWDGITDSYRRPTRDYYETKAVYCPVYPETDSIDLRKADKQINISIYNGQDFTDLNEVSIDWSLCIDGRTLRNGQTTLNAAPHTSATLTIPASNVKTKAGETAYVLLVFKNAKGEEMGRRTVDIITSVPQAKTSKVVATETDKLINVKNGSTVYTFSKTTGALTSVSQKGKTLLTGLRPAVWHQLDDGDYIIKNRKFAKGQSPEDYKTTVRNVRLVNDGQQTIVEVTADYLVNDSNHMAATYTYTFDGSKMRLDYALTPHFQCSQLPLVGMAVKMSSPKALKQWFGLGPDDAWGNKRTGVVLGLWNAAKSVGTKEMRWLELNDGTQKLRISSNGWLLHDNAADSEIRIAAKVLGRSEKGRLNDEEYQLPSGKTYHGTISIEP